MISEVPLFKVGDVVQLKSNEEILEIIDEYFQHKLSDNYLRRFLNKQDKTFVVTHIYKSSPNGYEIDVDSDEFGIWKRLQDYFVVVVNNENVHPLFGGMNYVVE